MKLFNLANILTLINLLSCFMAVCFLFHCQMEWVPYCVVVCLVAEFLDGFAARLTKNPTDIGLQLDSLADVVSFGVVPGAIIFQLLFQKYEMSDQLISTNRMYFYSAPAFIITLFAALRLAKFNVDERQTDGFIGLATPASTMFVVGLLLMFLNNSFGLSHFIFSGKVLYGTVGLLSVLMIAEIPMFGFKFKSYGWKGNEVKYLFIILSVVLIAALKFAAVSLIIILYVIVSLIQKLITK